MAETTRVLEGKPARTAKEVVEQIAALEDFLRRGFSNSDELYIVVPYLTEARVKNAFVACISVPFDKVEVRTVWRLIRLQVKRLQQELRQLAR
jgi:hypothetical protein